MDDNAQTCPHCGCPAPNASARTFMNEDVLHQGKSTDAEEIVGDVADSVRRYCKIMAWISLILFPLYGIAAAINLGDVAGWIIILVCIAAAICAFYMWNLIGKIIWGVIRLFINMSTTLKRIEIKLEENGTR